MAPGFVGSLDGYTLVYAVSSARRLRSDWTGSIARIRSTGAGTPEQDFGYDAAGVINKSGIASFLGADSGVYRKWYDQSNNGHDFGQASASSQPAYSPTGLNGQATALFDGVDDGFISVDNIPAQSSWWGYVVAKPTANGTNPELWAIVSYPDSVAGYILFERASSTTIYYNGSSLSAQIPFVNNTAYSFVLKGTTSSRYAKSSAGGLISDGTDNSIVGGFKSTLGFRNDASAYLTGHICEIVLGVGTLTGQQETDIFTQLNAFWGTPIP